jgi:hypothetical protein
MARTTTVAVEEGPIAVSVGADEESQQTMLLKKRKETREVQELLGQTKSRFKHTMAALEQRQEHFQVREHDTSGDEDDEEGAAQAHTRPTQPLTHNPPPFPSTLPPFPRPSPLSSRPRCCA